MTVTIIVVLELILCAGWISQSNAQAAASLFPQEHQSVCRGESISYNCIGNGTVMQLSSPPIVNASALFVVLNSNPVETCNVIPNAAAAIVLVDSSRSSSFTGTFTLFISNEQSEGQRSVSCLVSTANGMFASSFANFSVLGAPTLSNIQTLNTTTLSYGDDEAQATVSISWESPVNAQEFSLTISNMTNGYTSTIRSLENKVTVLLPYGTYSATLCAINRCGKECKNFLSRSELLRIVPQINRMPSQPGSSVGVDPALLAAAIIAGVLGVFFIIAVISSVVITIKWIKK